jgi:hypothetical protein
MVFEVALYGFSNLLLNKEVRAMRHYIGGDGGTVI